MPDTPVTLTLPLTQAGAQVLLAALGIAVATGLVYLMLRLWRRRPRADPAVDLLKALGWALVPVWLILLGGTIWHLWLLFDGQASVLGDTGFGMGAVIAAFLGGPFVIWGTVIKQETVKYQKEGHITERITSAVEQLGEEKTVKRDGGDVTVPNIEVRIGGLLSLERIAQDSTQNDKGRDHVRVMEILCAYVRQNAPASEANISWRERWEEARDGKGPDYPPISEGEFLKNTIGDLAGELDDYVCVGATKHWAWSLPGPRADIALALQIIGRRSPDQRQVEARWGPTAAPDAAWVFDTPCPELPDPEGDAPHGTEKLDAFKAALKLWQARIDDYAGYRLDLRGTNLQGAGLSGLSLSGARLSGARMEGSAVFDARLEGAFLTNARMDGAIMFEARMAGADLFMASMEGADLSDTRMQGANARLSRMEDAYLSGARMVNADLQGARLEGANLSRAQMAGAELSEARMEGTTVYEARFNKATSFRATFLRSAALKEVDLSMLDLTQAQLDSAFGDSSVTLPDGLVRPAHWPTWAVPEFGDNSFYDEWHKWRADPAGYTPPPPPGD